LNRQEQCDTLDPSILQSLPLIRSFIQLQSLDAPKMKIDESKILKNINEFLLQSDPLNQAIQYN
jgi:hypothetical protein